jgi:hypothetical protein
MLCLPYIDNTMIPKATNTNILFNIRVSLHIQNEAILNIPPITVQPVRHSATLMITYDGMVSM